MVIKRAALLALLLTTTACTQPPAEVVLRGHEFFGRNQMAQLQPAAGVSNETLTSAPAPSVTSKDLAPPTKTAAVTPVKPAEPTHTIIAAKAPTQNYLKLPAKATAAAQTTTIKPFKTAAANLMWPVSSKKIISDFGPKGSGIVNDGINIAAKEGDPVWASADGEVVYVGSELKGYGNMAIIKHNGGKSTSYAHMGRITADKYDRVKQGDIIGYVGHTGDVKSPQLHFTVRDGNDPVDPIKFLNRNVASAQ